MPYLRVELHLWWLEWIVWRNVDVHVEDASLVASVFLLNGITRSIKEFIRTEIGPIGQKFCMTYRSEDFSFPVSEVIADNFSFNDLFALSLY